LGAVEESVGESVEELDAEVSELEVELVLASVLGLVKIH
jgi:hypothetical protein